jgi:regulator of cell morphogenesis and NO signaling
MQIVPDSIVGQLVTERPARSRLFEQLGIDYCCGGRKTLAQACEDLKLDLDSTLARLRADDALAAAEPAEHADPASLTVVGLIEHIERTHHAWLRSELPRLAGLLAKVADAHGQRDGRLIELHNTFEGFAYHLFSHMQKEERVLFPALRQLERGELDLSNQQSLADPIDAMTREHDEAGEALKTLRLLTDGFAPPEGACNTHRAMLDALAKLERDMHQHVHKENNILFPRARALAGLKD